MEKIQKIIKKSFQTASVKVDNRLALVVQKCLFDK